MQAGEYTSGRVCEQDALHVSSYSVCGEDGRTKEERNIVYYQGFIQDFRFGGETQHLGGSGGMFPQENAK